MRIREIASWLVVVAGLALPASSEAALAPARAYGVTVDYVTHFYPLWFTYFQAQIATHNHLVGPDHISPIYQIVVAINDDTLYASTFVDLDQQPLILTIPATTTSYSILTLDPYGDIFPSGIAAGTPGAYALTGPHYTGAIPAHTTRIQMPLDHMVLIFRADKFSSSGQDLTSVAETFRESLLTQTMSDYAANPAGGATAILPEAAFIAPFKIAADRLVQAKPASFLTQLQTAVAGAATPPMTAREKALSDDFNRLFAAAPNDPLFQVAVQDAHRQIVQSYLSHTDKNGWINFLNIGEWTSPGEDVARAAITEYIQYGNNHTTSAYYHSFRDRNGLALDGHAPHGYTITIPRDQIPQAKRFWSFTAYTPNAIELIPNGAGKYEIASYTPGLVYNPDGSLTLTIAQTQPIGVPAANWLPVGDDAFNIMLRVYGPEGSVAAGTYVPPPIVRQ